MLVLLSAAGTSLASRRIALLRADPKTQYPIYTSALMTQSRSRATSVGGLESAINRDAYNFRSLCARRLIEE